MTHKLPFIFFAAVSLVGCASTATTTPAEKTTTSTASSANACQPITQAEVAALFDRWNQSLQTGEPKKVVANYAEKSILLPTVSNKPRLTPAEKEDYFVHFLEKQPAGKIDMHHIEIGCNTAVDAGLYTFKFGKTGESVKARYSYTYRWDGKNWLITSHHSSAMPEKAAAPAKH